MAFFEMVRASVDRSIAAYDARRESNRQKALKRWSKDSDDSCHSMPQHADAYTGIPMHAEDANLTKPNQTKPPSICFPPEGGDTQKDEGKRKRFVPPSLEQVQAYCTERGNNVSASSFVDHYTAVGWKVGKTKMTDWKAAVRTWEKSDQEQNHAPAPKPIPQRENIPCVNQRRA